MGTNTLICSHTYPVPHCKAFRKTCGPPPLKSHVSLEDYGDLQTLAYRATDSTKRILLEDEVDGLYSHKRMLLDGVATSRLDIEQHLTQNNKNEE